MIAARYHRIDTARPIRIGHFHKCIRGAANFDRARVLHGFEFEADKLPAQI